MFDRDIEVNDLNVLAASISHPEALQCCCGNTDCVLLKHNCSVLDSVERDVHTAARLGQVCDRQPGAFCLTCLRLGAHTLFPSRGRNASSRPTHCAPEGLYVVQGRRMVLGNIPDQASKMNGRDVSLHILLLPDSQDYWWGRPGLAPRKTFAFQSHLGTFHT